MTAVRVDVTIDMIRASHPLDPERCAVALAIRRATGAWTVIVGLDDVWIRQGFHSDLLRFRLPARARRWLRWVTMFGTGPIHRLLGISRPFRFDLELPSPCSSFAANISAVPVSTSPAAPLAPPT